MSRLALCLIPATLLAGTARYARVGDFDGKVEVQLNAADPWQPVLRNMPVTEKAWLRTEGSARLELELDDGNVLRLAGDSLAELSDYTRLSTGQRITLISLDRGLAYFTGAAEGKDALILAVPGVQLTVTRGARLRLEAREQSIQLAAGDGSARFSSPNAEMDLETGHLIRLDLAHAARMNLTPEIPALETDRWNDERDKVLASTTSAHHVPRMHSGLSDLDAHGVWIESATLGTVWKPKVPEAWVPYRNGKWTWYEGLGYTWVSEDIWGWLPYHYGRWTQLEGTGWVWTPGNGTVFKPGEVYWLKIAKLVGWGPLAPSEDWTPSDVPRLFLNANTTYAPFAAGALVVESGSPPPRPQEPLATAVFLAALPSPPLPAARLDATRPVLRAGSTRIVPVLNGVTFEGETDVAAARGSSAQQPAPTPAPARAYAGGSQQPLVIVTQPPPEPEGPTEVYYPVPVYTGIIVVNPPERKGSAPPPAQSSNNNKSKSVQPPAPGSNTPPPHGQPKPAPGDPEKPVK